VCSLLVSGVSVVKFVGGGLGVAFVTFLLQ
jgi:hypothetical protein